MRERVIYTLEVDDDVSEHTRSMSNDPKPTLFRPGIGKRGMTELHYAAYCGDLHELTRCLDAGMDPNVTDQYRGYTATPWLADMAATGGPRLAMLRALVAHGADLNLKSGTDATALSLTREAGSKCGDALAAELLALGANPE
jgi:ankyrin repeat protein